MAGIDFHDLISRKIVLEECYIHTEHTKKNSSQVYFHAIAKGSPFYCKRICKKETLVNWSLSLAEVIPFSDTNHCSRSLFFFKSWSWGFSKSSNSTFSQFSHLRISVHFSPLFFWYLRLVVLQPVLQPQIVSLIRDSGVCRNFVTTALYSCISMPYF